MKKYTDIIRLGHRTTLDVLKVGDLITIEEKIDGANGSFLIENGELEVYSRNVQLNENNNLNGFYNWVFKNIDKENLNFRYIYFGEWLIKHKIEYYKENMKKFYLFDIYDKVTEKYLPFSHVLNEAIRLNINHVPVFYEGPYRDMKQLEQFVGQSELGNEGEGIVIKNTGYVNRFGHQMFVKLVREDYQEIKPIVDSTPLASTVESIWVMSVVTIPRIEKMLYKLIDEGILDSQYGIEDMGYILKILSGRMYEDIMKEESDSLPSFYNDKLILKSLGKILPGLLKSIIRNNTQIIKEGV